jgi:autotransporter-associated beta strand protein
VHLDATQITQANGSDMITWTNLVSGGAGDFAASTGTAAPLFHAAGNLLNGLPLVKFRNSVTLRNTSFNYTNQNNTVMFAGRMDGGQSARLVGGAANNWLLGYHGGYQNRSHPAAWLHQPTTGIDFTTRIYGQVMTANGRTAEFFGNGIRLAGPVNNSGFRGPDGLTLGGYLTTSEMSLGSLGEVLVFNRALTDVERQQMETYLQAKWQGPLNPFTDVAITGGGSLNLNGVNQTIGSLAGDSTGQVLLNGGWLTVGTVNTNTTYSGVIADGATGGGTLAKTGIGVLTLAGDTSNSYTGPTVLQAGLIHLAKTGGAYAIPGDFLGVNNAKPYVYTTQDNQFAPGSVMYFLNNEGDHVRFELLGTTQTLGGIDNGGMANKGVIQHRENISSGLQVSTTSTLILDVAEGDAYLFAGYLRHQNNTLSVVKSGAGTQTLSGGYITYNGTTTVNAGTLALQDTTGFASYMNMVPGSTLNLIRTATGFSNRGNLTRLITGSGTINVNATGNTPGTTDGGWVRFETAGTRGLDNFTGTVNVNTGNLTRDNVSTWSGNPTLNVYNNAFFGIRNVDTSVDGLNGNGHVGNDYNADTAGHTLTVGAANGSGVFSGVIHGSLTGGTDGMIDQGIVHFAKAGSGTQTLSGTNTYSGTTTVRAGTLVLDFTAAGAPVSNILLSGRSLILAGGTLEIKGVTGQNSTVQTVGNTTVNGPSTLKLTQNGATTADVNLGALTFNLGAKINFAGGTGTSLGARFITTTSAGANDGQTRLGSCTWNGTEWASIKEVSGVKYVVPWEGTYTNIATGTEEGGSVVVPNAPTSAVRILEGGTTGGPNELAQATTIVGSLMMIAGTTPSTVKMNTHGANDTLVLGDGASASGVAAVAAGAQALTLGQSAGQGFVTAGTSGASTLSLVANNPELERGITVHSRIQNNAGGGAVSLSMSGDGTGGTVVLTANNSYTGPTGIGGGTLQLADAGSLGEGTYSGSITNNGLLRYSSSAGQILSGAISGTGALLKDTDASVLTLTGNNTYSGSTTVSNGTLKLQGAAFYAGARTYSIASGAVLNLDGTFNSSMPANSTTTINGAGTLRFTGGTFFLNNGATGKNVAISLGAGGLIDVQAGSTLGNGGWASIIWSANLAALNVDGTVDVWDGNTLYVDALTGNGVLTHTSYGNGQNVTVGVNNGSGTFRGTITQQNASRITSLTKTGSGTQTLTGTNSYSGATTVSAGTLQIGEDGTTGTLGTGAVVNNADLVFNRSDAYNVTNVISGTGTLTQDGTGTLTLSATNTYTGATSVNAGTLRVNGALAAASAVTVKTNASLAWTGTVYGSVTLNSGGRLLMDSSDIRTVGALTLNEGSILDVSGLALTGYEVPLMNYTTLTGTFTTLNAAGGWKIEYNYSDQKVIALVRSRGTMVIFQ